MKYELLTEKGKIKKVLIGAKVKTECGKKFRFFSDKSLLLGSQMCPYCGKIIVLSNKKSYLKKKGEYNNGNKNDLYVS